MLREINELKSRMKIRYWRIGKERGKHGYLLRNMLMKYIKSVKIKNGK